MIAVALEESKKIFNQLKSVKQSGERCRNNAVWIGVIRYVISHIYAADFLQGLQGEQGTSQEMVE